MTTSPVPPAVGAPITNVGAPTVFAPQQPQMQTSVEAPAVAVQPDMDQRVAALFAEQQAQAQQAQQQLVDQPGAGGAGAGVLGTPAPAQYQAQPQVQSQPPVQPQAVPPQVPQAAVTPERPTINPYLAPAPSDTADLFGVQVTRQDAELIAQHQQFLAALTPAQLQAFERTLQNPGILDQQVQQPQVQQPYQPYQPTYQPPVEQYPVNPNIPVQKQQPAPGQTFFGPSGTTGQQLAQQPNPLLDPFAQPQPTVPVQPPYAPQYIPPQPDPTVQQLQAQVAEMQRQQAEAQAQSALQAQAAAYKPYGDAAIAHIQQQYQLQPHEMQQVVATAQQSSQLLQNAFAQSPGDPTAAYVAVMDSIVWGDPTLRARAATTLGAQQAQSIAQINQQRARAGSLAASGGTIPRQDAVPVDASGRPNYRQGMVGALAGIMNGQNGQQN